MTSLKSKWAIGIAALGCVACCALPLYGVIAGASSFGALAFLSQGLNMDVVLCLLPLVFALIYFTLRWRKNQKQCCATPSQACSSKQCQIHGVENSLK